MRFVRCVLFSLAAAAFGLALVVAMAHGSRAVAQSSPAAANPALLIVNKDYREIDKLPTAENDGRRLAEVLRKRPGFSPELEPEKDLTPAEFEQRWSAFREQILAMKTDGVAVFYFPVTASRSTTTAILCRSMFQKAPAKASCAARARACGVCSVSFAAAGGARVTDPAGEGQRNFCY
ncbi:MAG: caspase family protein [Chloroflexaceae bacterium]|nr:caspase family protein [Chloroflexaceae bacterium]